MFPWNFSPFNKEMLNQLKNLRPEEVENYVQDIMGKMFPSHMEGMDVLKAFQGSSHASPSNEEKKQEALPSIFETHDDVFVHLPIEDREVLKGLKISHTSNILMIDHLSEEKYKKTLPLPSIVKKKGARAYYKDGLLEIKLPKSIDFQYSEIDIREK